MSAVKERKSLSADTPRSWKPDFKPRDYPDYLNHVEQGYLQTLAKHVQEAIDAPSAFQGVAYNSTPRDEDHVLANDYKAVADPGDQALKPIDDTNKRLFRILYAAAQTYPFAKGTMDSAPFVRYSTFKAFIISKFGGDTKTAAGKIILAKAAINSNPNHPNLLLNIDDTLEVSSGEQTSDFFARIATARNEVFKLTTQEPTMEAVFQLVEFRLKTLPSNTGHGTRYNDAEWTKIAAKHDDITELEREITTIDSTKPGEDTVEANQAGSAGAFAAGGGSIHYMKESRNIRDGGRKAQPRKRLPFGPSDEKSKTDCPFQERCRQNKDDKCFYKHGSKFGKTEWPSRQGTSKTDFKSHAAKAPVGTAYIIEEDGNGGKRLREERPGGGTKPRKKVHAAKTSKGKTKAKQVNSLTFGLGTMMTAALTVACLFGKVADASVFNLIAPSDDRKNTFHTAFTIDNTTSLETDDDTTCFAYDTGCTTRGGACNDSTKFHTLQRKQMNPIRAADGQLVPVHGIGTIKMSVDTNKGKRIIMVKGVYFVPELTVNVFSDHYLVDEANYKFTYSKDTGPTVTLPDGSTMSLDTTNGLKLFRGQLLHATDSTPAINESTMQHLHHQCNSLINGSAQPTPNTVDNLIKALNEAPLNHQARDPIRKALAKLNVYTTNTPATDRLMRMHAALGHPSAERLTQFLKDHLTPKQLHRHYGAIASLWCEGCELAKVTRAAKTGLPMERSKHFAAGTTYDVIGPYPDGKGTGFKYSLVFVDEATSFITVRGMKTLTEVPATLDVHFSWLKTVQGKSVKDKRLYQGHVNILDPTSAKRVHSDCASYFLSAEAQKVYRKHNATHTQSAPYSQHQNRTERMIRTLKSTATAMLLASHGTTGQGLEDCFWFFALCRAAHCYNILPNSTNEHFVSPTECITGKPATPEHEHVFGSPVVALKMTKRSKKPTAAKGELGIWLGYNKANNSNIIHVPRHGTSGSFRQTRHIRLPKKLLSHKLLDGSVPLDAEHEYVQHDYRGGVYKAPPPPSPTTEHWYPEVEQASTADMQNVTEIDEAVENQQDMQQEDDDEVVLPRSQEECEDDEIFISALYHDQTQCGDNISDIADDSNNWTADDIDYKPSPITSDFPTEAELLSNIDNLVDDNITDDVYDNEEHAVFSIGPTYYTTSKAFASEHGDLFRESDRKEVTQQIDRGMITPMPIDDPRVVEYLKQNKIMRSIKFHHLKYRADGTIKAKSRWCCADIKGASTQSDPTHCGTPSWTTNRVLLAETARINGTLYQADIPNAFSIGDKNATFAVMSAPPGEQQYDERGVQIVYGVRNVYGRRSAGHVYQQTFFDDMRKIGAVTSKLDPCLLEFKPTKSRGRILLCAWIDDLVISTQCPEAAKWLKKELKSLYERREGDDIDFRTAQHLLGMDVVQNKHGIHISQTKLIDQLIEHYKMSTAREMPTPVPTGTKISKEDCPKVPESHDYRHGVAIILYLSTVTRPDLCYTASQLGRVQAAPGKPHMAALLNVCRYLKKTRRHGILFKRGNQRPTDSMLEAFADAGWAAVDTSTIAPEVGYADLPRDNGKSSGGYLIRYNGAPIEFKSKVIHTVCLSTAEAELKAAAECAKALRHIRQLVEQVALHKLTEPTKIYEDASAVIAQCEGTSYTINSRVRHIGVAFWFLRQLVVEAKEVVLVKIGTKEQLADIMTKFLSKVLHEALASQLVTTPPE